MELNFDAPVRLTEALLPLLRASAPSAIVNVASTAGRVSRARTGAYSASKFALIGWSDSLYAEELPHGVHVGLVLPGFIQTEGFPATELREKALTRWIVSKPPKVAEAIFECGPGRKPERYVPRPYALAAVARILLPGLTRRVLTGGAASSLTTSTAADCDPGVPPPPRADARSERESEIAETLQLVLLLPPRLPPASPAGLSQRFTAPPAAQRPGILRPVASSGGS